MSTEHVSFAMRGGLDLQSPLNLLKPGTLRIAKNVEPKIGGGYARTLGYAKIDANEVTGTGDILGVWIYNDKYYAFREQGGGTVTMFESSGSGWTAKKTGLTTGGSYEFVNANIGGQGTKMYGVSGTHKAFEWDGSTWTDLTTGMSPDTPEHVAAHKNHLFLSFGKSVQFSSIGDPTSWDPITGAAEMVMDDNVTAMSALQNGVLGIFSQADYSLLYGSSSADFTKSKMADSGMRIGAYERTVQNLGTRVRLMGNRGVTDLNVSNEFGSFADAMLSRPVQSLVQQKKSDVTCSCVVRAKSQYRLFFDDGTGLIFAFEGDAMIGITELKWPLAVLNVVSTELSDGTEMILFGSSDGYIYRMETGGLLGSSNIESMMATVYSSLKQPNRVKRFRRAFSVAHSDASQTLYVKPEAMFEDEVPLLNDYDSFDLSPSGGILGAFTLNTSLLGGVPFTDGRAEITSTGEYLSIIFYSNTSVSAPWELDDLTISYSPGRIRRG